MKKLFCILLTLLILSHSKAGPLDEDYGYVDVREGAHMFWVVYHTELPGDWSTHPLILWLQGGPGVSGVGYGNFLELGPYDINGNLREGRWTKKANLMFIDNPVGTGYSYVDSPDLYCTNNTQIADDLVTLITSVFTNYPDMQKMPFFVYAESYGGKMTADFAIALDAAIARGDITSNFQGIAMGDSWISPMDSVNTWGSYLYWMGMVNKDGQAQIDAAAARTQEAVDNGNWVEATAQCSITEGVVETVTYGVDFYNVLSEDSNAYFVPNPDDEKLYSYFEPEMRKSFFRHVKPYPKKVGDELDDFMNGPQKAHWNISDDVTWGDQSCYVDYNLRGDFMKPVVESVAYLLNNSHIHVAVYTGNLDLICNTPGTYRWIENMQYNQKSRFVETKREALHVSTYSNVAAYSQRYERFSLFTILRSGHMVPIDAPEMSLKMIDIITGYGNETVSAKRKAEVAKKLHKVKHAKVALHEAKENKETKETLHETAEAIHLIKQEAEKIKEKQKQVKQTKIKKK
ncbi:Retinoid-inducible serine carboxypeptidase [Armadillidium nasatum]|uniref:Carboxypeptidase n=1 Tax=Armadillidium nasatum TaxID=96803 RepID=A0A5N5SQ45_9CRUS|nr:Retinoid-inducible serine carboxypeptidase [Armadillidium nasatum]